MSGPTRLTRVKRRPEFLRIQAQGNRWAAPGLVLQVRIPKEIRLLDGSAEESAGASVRVGFTATKRIGGAVARNRAKRRLRAVADEILPVWALPGVEVVLICRQGTLSRPYDLLKSDLIKALKRCKAARKAADA